MTTTEKPTIIFTKNHNKNLICAKFKGFESETDMAGYGDNEEQAKEDLMKQSTENLDELAENTKPFGVKIFVCEMIEDMPHELVVAHLRSEKPFTKDQIERFIESDEMMHKIRKSVEDEQMEFKTFYIISNQ